MGPDISVTQILWGALLALGAAGAAYRLGALSRSGAWSAWVVGGVIFGVGGWRWAAALLVFFLTSSALSRARRRSKAQLGFEKTGPRDAGQVWANGGAATACALLSLLAPQARSPDWFLLFLAALAAANADTWATEIGAAFGGRPYRITTLQRAPPGTSGAVSAIGTLAALAGAALLGLFALSEGWAAAGTVTLAGLGGALLDSLLGATIQSQWHDPAQPERWTERAPPGASGSAPERGLRGVGNDLVNALCTLFAVLLAALLLQERGNFFVP